MKRYITQMSLSHDGDSPVFGESAIHITVDDDGAGWFFVLSQTNNDGEARIRVDLEDLRELLDCAEEMAKQESQCAN